ncbi:hydrogenase maturation protease [Seonamhaeicola sp.]|uniref:hydrogenase maturation protease n=1 Tax=Seonamhaeicola sp. TaxID=1912245 RepID=UPI0026225982|nr:hydrogenase maturation protease [Seonamhaeicola sp.]
MKNTDKKTIIIGIGNNGRQDDGLGWALMDYLETLDLNLDIEYRYQLQIEDAELMSQYDQVIFVDATKDETITSFSFDKCEGSEAYSFSTHALMPETVMFLCNNVYKKYPEAHILAIKGYEWELQIGLTPKGEVNLEKAKNYFKETIVNTYL